MWSYFSLELASRNDESQHSVLTGDRNESVCVVALTLLAGLWVVLVLFDRQIQRAVLVGHEQLAEDGILVVCRPSPGGVRAGRWRSP